MAEGEEINIKDLQGHKDKIKELMRRDPKFIGRLITQLDSQMHKMMLERQKRVLAIKEDSAAVAKLDETMQSHVVPNLERLTAQIAEKQQLREAVSKQIEAELGSFKSLEREAAAAIARARHASGKLMGKTASDSLQQARGFTSTVPTTTLLRSNKKPPRTTGS